MRITNSHIAYWTKRKGPKWVKFNSQRPPVSATIDDCVNDHAAVPPADERQATSLLSSLKSYRKRGEDAVPYLDRVAASTGRVASSRRAAFARKWGARLRRQRKSQKVA